MSAFLSYNFSYNLEEEEQEEKQEQEGIFTKFFQICKGHIRIEYNKVFVYYNFYTI
jgi:hypothetical protein